jgi:hypothetical protein
MAVTAHWMQSITVDSVSGYHQKIVLRTDLIGFHRIPGRHTGEHLAQCFLYILDRIDIAEKVSHSICFLRHNLIGF